MEATLLRKQRFDRFFEAAAGDLFVALAQTLAFRRWGLLGNDCDPRAVPSRGCRYSRQAGSTLRTGRVVEIIRPVAITLKEVLDDPPCRVSLIIRWRIEPLDTGCRVRLYAEYRLNRAAMLRPRHWERRLRTHFGNQFGFLATNLHRIVHACTKSVQRHET
jgi:hypothetical protein